MEKQRQVTSKHTALHDFIGDWNVSQKVWSAPNAQPVSYKGKSRCSVLLDGLATVMTTEIDATGFKGIALMTYNQKQNRYDLAYVDTISDEGLLIMNGQSSGAPSAERLTSTLGRKATAEREWQTGVSAGTACLPGDALQFAARAIDASRAAIPQGIDDTADIPMRLVENKVSNDEWVLEFFVPNPDGGEFLAQQNTFTRAGKGKGAGGYGELQPR
jgi:hypothetical protein